MDLTPRRDEAARELLHVFISLLEPRAELRRSFGKKRIELLDVLRNIGRQVAKIRIVQERGFFLAHLGAAARDRPVDRKSTRLDSSHGYTSYAVFFWKKKG